MKNPNLEELNDVAKKLQMLDEISLEIVSVLIAGLLAKQELDSKAS